MDDLVWDVGQRLGIAPGHRVFTRESLDGLQKQLGALTTDVEAAFSAAMDASWMVSAVQVEMTEDHLRVSGCTIQSQDRTGHVQDVIPFRQGLRGLAQYHYSMASMISRVIDIADNSGYCGPTNEEDVADE